MSVRFWLGALSGSPDRRVFGGRSENRGPWRRSPSRARKPSRAKGRVSPIVSPSISQKCSSRPCSACTRRRMSSERCCSLQKTVCQEAGGAGLLALFAFGLSRTACQGHLQGLPGLFTEGLLRPELSSGQQMSQVTGPTEKGSAESGGVTWLQADGQSTRDCI